MDVWPPPSSGIGIEVVPERDPRLRPTPDYGTLGPGSDVSDSRQAANPGAPKNFSLRTLHLLAAVAGMLLAIIAGMLNNLHRPSPTRHPTTAADMRQLDRMTQQKQAETLLELAVGQTAGANEQISSRVDRWPGHVKWSRQIANLSAAALNSSDMRVRESGIEVELAAYGLGKNSTSFDYLIKSAESPNHQQKIWALWALGLMANRGVQADRAVEILTAHLKDSDVDSRRWAVEGLALTGSDQTIQPLLLMMHDDPSPLVRERAACGLAESGMYTPQQRMTAVPQLLNYTDDPTLDAQTHSWAFHALNDITQAHLPNDSATWREWYAKKVDSE
jgi:hypothetical protein